MFIKAVEACAELVAETLRRGVVLGFRARQACRASPEAASGEVFGAEVTSGGRLAVTSEAVVKTQVLSGPTWHLEWCAVAGVRTRYAVAGEVGRPPVVLLHGIGRSLEDWSASAALAARYRLYAPDLVGFGYTDKPRGPYSLAGLAAFVKSFLEVLEVAPPVFLVENSLGGAVAQAFAAAYPERVRGLVLVASAGFGADVTLALRLVTVPGLGELLLRPSRYLAERTVASLFYDPGFATEERTEHALELARQSGAARAFLAVARPRHAARPQGGVADGNNRPTRCRAIANAAGVGRARRGAARRAP